MRAVESVEGICRAEGRRVRATRIRLLGDFEPGPDVEKARELAMQRN